MKILKKTLLLLFLVSSIACSRNQGDSSVVNNTSEENTVQPELSEGAPEIDSNSVANDSIANNANNAESPAENQETQIENQESGDWFKSNTGYNWWMIGAIVSLVINLVLFLLLKKTMKSIKKYKKEKKSFATDYKNLQARINESINKKNELFRENQALKSELRHKVKPPPRDKPKQNNDTVDDEKPVEVPLSVNNPPDTTIKQPVNLYAEKATEASIFSNVSDQKNEHRSIFKLSLEDRQADTAQFEVLNSDYILKMAVNSPDTYLYTVCKPENSNQNFSGEITTLKKGIAHKIDGKWQVKDENKATIKFQ